MPSLLRFDVLGIVDIISAVLIFYTQSFIPTEIAYIHATILITKGIGGIIRPVKFPFFVYVLGGMADVLSAGILFTGTPPVLNAYKGWLSGILLLKGLWSLFGLMQKF